MATNKFNTPYKVLRRFRFLPLIMRNTKNWPKFMNNYAFGKTDGVYRFRNGGKLKLFAGFDHVPVIEVIMKKDYGKIPDNALILDIGASTGVFTVYASATSTPISIFAFEPSADYFATLQENVQLNNLGDKVKCFNMAVAGVDEVRDLTARSRTFIYPSLLAGGEGGTSKATQCISLQSIVENNNIEKVDLLKMDCEGAEYEIFLHTPDAVFRKIKEIRMEYHNIDNQKNVEALRNILKAKGFMETYFKPTNSIFGNIWFNQAI